MVGKMDMSEFTNSKGENEMFDSLHEEICSDKYLSEYILFDKQTYTVWVMWYE